MTDTPERDDRPADARSLTPPLGMETVEDVFAAPRALADRGELAAAIAAYRAALVRHPLPAGHAALAELLERRGDMGGALQELDRALERAPDDPQMLVRRAVILGAALDFDAAEEDLRRAVRIDDRNVDAHIQLGMLACKRARWRDAVDPLRRAVELAPDRAAAHYQLGEAYNQTDQLDQALASYERAAALEPTNWRALKGVGIVLDRLRRPEEAAEAYRRSREAQRR